MKTILASIFVSASLACATAPLTPPTTTPPSTPTVAAPAEATQPAAPAQSATAAVRCDSGLTLLNATLWMQTSAEYRAIALQTFQIARHALDAALDNPFAKGALEETANDPAQPPAIILDLDETVLDNTPFEARMIRAHKTYDSKTWKQWTAEGAAHAIPGAADFLQYAKSRGVTPFYVTNRDLDEEAGTRANLEKLGYPLDPRVDTLLVRGKNGWTTSDKTPRRAFVASKYRVLLLFGDDLNDFAPAAGKTLAERTAIVDSVRSWWGEIWFVLPNPMYGSWERALAGSGSDCEQTQRKVDALQ
jgi:acid phosphatase